MLGAAHAGRVRRRPCPRKKIIRSEQQNADPRVFTYMDSDDPGVVDEIEFPGTLRQPQDAEAAVGALYQAHALGLIRLAYVMLGAARRQDVVQEAFCGLYRRWEYLADPDRALAYVRSSVLNGCRSALRRQTVRRALVTFSAPPSRPRPRCSAARNASR